MKIAISVPDELFARADAAATQIGLNRSQLYVRALTELLDRIGDDPVTARLNELAEDPASREENWGSAAARRLIEAGDWEW